MMLERKVAIVTGGASGIGAALGEALVRRSCFVVLADVDEEGARREAERMSGLGPGSAVARAVDVRDPEAVTAMVQETAESQGHLDLLFNNAGIGIGGDTEELSLAHWERTIDVDLYGVLHGVRAAYPLMLAQGDGHIVNTASMAGLVPSPGLLPYSTAKFGVVGLSLGLRAEAATRGVRVSVVCPGVIDTPILDAKQHEGLPAIATEARTRTEVKEFFATMTGSRALYPPRQLAEDVLRGVEANKAIIVAPGAARLGWALWRLAPGLLLKLSIDRFEVERSKWQSRRSEAAGSAAPSATA